MRISVTKSDPGYFEGAYRCTAYLDGVKIDNCLTADEEEGLALCYDMSDEGRQYARMSGEVRLIEVRGQVEINTRDEDGVCILCGVSGAEMHHDHCPRAKEWNHTEAQARLVAFGDPAKSGGVVISSRGPEYYLVPPKGMEMPAPVDLPREWKPGDSPVLPETETYEEGGLRVRFIDPEKSYVTAEECKAYVVTRLKASEPLACRSCGRTDGHDAKCPSDILSKMLGMFGAAHSSAMAEARKADEAAARKARLAAIGMTEEQYAEYCARTGPISAADFKAILGPSTISKLMARRRKLIAKAKRASPEDSAVGSAIAAMNRPGRAHEL